jgi:hypothetical protein
LFSKFSDEAIADRALGRDPWNRKRSARFTEQALMRRGIDEGECPWRAKLSAADKPRSDDRPARSLQNNHARSP